MGKSSVKGYKDSLFCHVVLASLVILFAGTACTIKSDISLPVQSTPFFSEAGTGVLPAYWWRAFEDERLSAHVAKALENNFTLASVWQRLQAARAVARRESSELWPDLDLGASAQRQTEDNGERINTFEIGPEAAYEVDLWRRISATVEAERLRAQASEEDYRTAALTLSGDVALTWYRLVEAHNQLDLLKHQIVINEKVLQVLNARFGVGLARSEDILRQRLLIESIREDVIVVETQIDVLVHQLAILRGEAPQGRDYEITGNLPALPVRPDAGLPADLIRRRPDVRRAYYSLEAADRDLAAAIRDQYPRLMLAASYVSVASTASNLFSTWLTTLGGTLLGPIFDGGQRQAEIDRTEALRAQRVNEYGQTVLLAFQEVEDALIREKKQLARINNLEKRLAIAKDTYEQIQIGYFNGVSDYIAVLIALDEMQQIERDLLLARRNLVEFRIALYRALAGGFETPREIKEKDNSSKTKSKT